MSKPIHVAAEATTLICFLTAASKANQSIVTKAAASSVFLPLLRRLKERMRVLVKAPLLDSPPARLSRGEEASLMQACLVTSTVPTESTR